MHISKNEKEKNLTKTKAGVTGNDEQQNTTNTNNKTYPELVASYDTRSGNEVGLFYQFRAPPGGYLNINVTSTSNTSSALQKTTPHKPLIHYSVLLDSGSQSNTAPIVLSVTLFTFQNSPQNTHSLAQRSE